jgi:hypothetical protein
MSKLLIVFLALFLSIRAEAGIYPIFKVDQATLMITGLGHDIDAQHLFETLAAGSQDEQGKWTKKVKFTDKSGLQVFSVVCVFSKLVEGNGSCTVVLKAANGVAINKDQKTFTFDLQDPAEAEKMAAIFLPAPSGVVYRSANGKFEAVAERNAANEVTHFVLSYR